jgi:hypothetical protein
VVTSSGTIKKANPLAKYDGIRGQEILEIEEGENEVTVILRDNRYLFVKIVDGKLVTTSVPE